MKKLLFAIAFGAILVVACNKEQEISEQRITSQTAIIRAAGEEYSDVDLNGVTKGTLDASGNFIWALGDKLGVRLYKGSAITGHDDGSGYDAWDATFSLKDEDADKAQGEFTCPTNVDEWLKAYAAWYPRFDETDKTNIGGDAKLYFYLKSWYDGYTSGKSLMPMMADMSSWSITNTKISLKHVGAGIRVTLKDVPAEANQASLTVAGKNIAGWFTVDDPTTAGTASLVASDGTDNNTIYLKFDTASDKRDITFIFPLPTVDLSGGISLKLYYNNGTDEHAEFWSRTASNLPALKRGELLDMPELTVPVTPEESKAPIWIDGKTKDWTNVSHTTTTSSNRILEWKYTQDDNNLYFLYKIDASKIDASSSGSYKWGSYIYIGFDTDNDATKGQDGSGGLGGGMEYRVVVFPWIGTTATGLECFVGVDEDGHIDDLLNNSTSSEKAKVGSKIDGSYSYVEVRIPRSAIGNPTGPITVKHAMNYYPTDAKQILPELVTIDASDQTVDVGKSVQIGAKANSPQAITYVSNDENIATVDANGVITGVAEGSTTITLSVDAVAGEYSAATKTINVTVAAAFTPAIVVDGDLSDWAGVAAYPSTGSSRIREWKFKSDERFVYFYFSLRKNRSYAGKHLVIGFNTDNNESTGFNYDTNKILGIETQVSLDPFKNASDAEPDCYNGYVTDSEIKIDGQSSLIKGAVYVYGYDAGESLSSDNSSTYIELSIPREKLNLAASGSITVGCSFDYYVTGTQSITL